MEATVVPDDCGVVHPFIFLRGKNEKNSQSLKIPEEKAPRKRREASSH